MRDSIISVLKKIVFAIFFIYAFDIIATGLKLFIPINFITIGVVSTLGVSGFLALVAVYFVLL